MRLSNHELTARRHKLEPMHWEEQTSKLAIPQGNVDCDEEQGELKSNDIQSDQLVAEAATSPDLG